MDELEDVEEGVVVAVDKLEEGVVVAVDELAVVELAGGEGEACRWWWVKGVGNPLLLVGTRTGRCNRGCLDLPSPQRAPLLRFLLAGIVAIIRTLHVFDRCFV